MLTELRQLRDHLARGLDTVLEALAGATPMPADAAREFTHIGFVCGFPAALTRVTR